MGVKKGRYARGEKFGEKGERGDNGHLAFTHAQRRTR